MCKWLDNPALQKFDKFYFFNLREKFVEKKKLQGFLSVKIILTRAHVFSNIDITKKKSLCIQHSSFL